MINLVEKVDYLLLDSIFLLFGGLTRASFNRINIWAEFDLIFNFYNFYTLVENHPIKIRPDRVNLTVFLQTIYHLVGLTRENQVS